MLWWGRERKGEACLLTLHLLELDIRTPARGSTRGRGLTRGRDLTRRRVGARCAPWKFGGFAFIILKPRAEGYETEIVANFAVRGPINRLTCMRIAQTQNTLTVWVFASDETRARWHTAAKFHGTSPRGEQSSTEAVAEVQMNNRWLVIWVRNRNNEGRCSRFVKAEKSEEWMARSPVWPDDVIASETASRHQPMNWRDSIWVFRLGPQWAFPKRSAQCWVTYEREQLAHAMLAVDRDMRMRQT